MERRSVTAGRSRRRSGRSVALVGIVGVMLTARTATAQAPEAVRDGQAAPGVYVGSNPVDPAPLASAVARARQAGVQLVVVVAEDPRPDADAFATRVRQLGVGDPVLVLGPGGQLGASSEELPGSDVHRARAAAAAAAATPDSATEAFVQALLHEEETSVPDLVGEVVRIGAVALVVLVLTAAADRALRRRRRRRKLARRAPSVIPPG